MGEKSTVGEEFRWEEEGEGRRDLEGEGKRKGDMSEERFILKFSSPIDLTRDFTAAERPLFKKIDFRLVSVSRGFVPTAIESRPNSCGPRRRKPGNAPEKLIGEKNILPELEAVESLPTREETIFLCPRNLSPGLRVV